MSAYFTAASVTRKRAFRCAFCDHRARAIVTGVGEGTASSLNVTGGGPQATAKRRAEAEAEKDVDRCLAAVACPNCGKRSGSAMRKAWMRVLLGAGLGFAVCAAVGWSPALFSDDGVTNATVTAGWVMTGIGAFVALIAILVQKPSTKSIDARVQFETETYRDGAAADADDA